MRLSVRVFHAVLYEAVALLCIAILLPRIADVDAQKSLGIGLFLSVAAMLWNIVFNAVFDVVLQRRIGTSDKTLATRILHAVLFEVTFVCLTLPVVAWALAMPLWQALKLEGVIIVFVLIYTFFFNLAFDGLWVQLQRRGLEGEAGGFGGTGKIQSDGVIAATTIARYKSHVVCSATVETVQSPYRF